jgi:RNA polymerase sigma-70 factor (ECF subfamily)
MMHSEAVNFPLSKPDMQAEVTAVSRETEAQAAADPSAWVDEHGDYLFRYAVVRLRDEIVAEDIVQETLLSAIQSLKSYGGKSTERTWLTSILKHKIVDHFRKSVREVPIGEEETDLSGLDVYFERDDQWTGHWNNDFWPTDWNLSPEATLERSEFYMVLEGCMSKMPERVAGVFAMREMDGLDSSEICELLNLSSNNFWVIMHRARMLLRRCIELNWFKKIQ